MKGPLRHLRWQIGFVLFLSTVINYIDRQTLSVLAPYIKTEMQWDNSTFALLIIAFRLAYAFGQSASGRLLDRIGIRKGLTLGVAFYSIAAMLTSLGVGLKSLCAFRFLLGLGESANWPGAAKVVSEWFPRRESGWAVALYDSGSAVGGALAPLIVLAIYQHFGSWRPAFLITGILGLLWIPLFRAIYRRPEEHPRLADSERALILEGRGDATVGEDARLPYSTLLRLPQTWGIIGAKALTDPVWFFITDWFALYLVSRGFRPEDSLLAFWAPFLAADIGNFAGGGFSSFLIQRGWSTGASRRAVALVCGAGMSLLGATLIFRSFEAMVACFSIATFAYAGFSTIVLALPADLYKRGNVASVSGMGGTAAGIGTILATYATGVVADRVSFEPILLVASAVPLLATVLLITLVRKHRDDRSDVLNPF